MKKKARISVAVVMVLCVGLGFLLSCRTPEVVCGPVSASELVDGVYQGTGTDLPVKVVVEVTIRNQRIAKIELLKHRKWRGGAAEKAVPERIILAQSTQVDAVSGATISSRAIMKAVQNAVGKALR